jgi:hypothetical protein
MRECGAVVCCMCMRANNIHCLNMNFNRYPAHTTDRDHDSAGSACEACCGCEHPALRWRRFELSLVSALYRIS